MSTLFFSHPACLEPDPGDGHPERPDRLRAIEAALEGSEFAALQRREAPLGEHSDILRVHDGAYLAAVQAVLPSQGRAYLDADTAVSPGSGEAALRAVGAVTAAVDAVAGGRADNAFCAVRPPGHHAEPARAMGFCLFNNAAIGARYAQARHGLERILIVDWDVHHGNGTQEIFYSDPDVFYLSTHQYPYYPGTGAANETGEGPGANTVVNVPLPSRTSARAHRTVFSDALADIERRFRPDLIIISAGFDSRREDPLGGLLLEDTDFVEMTKEVMGFAERHAEGRVVALLEGGYNLDNLGRTVRDHIAILSG